VLLALLGLLLGILLSHNDRLSSDGYDHFVYLRSVWIDHDLDLANDYAALSPRGRSVDPPTPIGRTGNLHPIGPALAWSPLYLVADLLCRATGRVPDGQNELYRNAVAIAGLLYGWLGLLVLYRMASAREGRGAGVLATLGIGLGTFLFFYLVFAPTMAHAPGFAAVCLSLSLWLDPPRSGARGAAMLGAAIGAASLMRWTNVLLLLLPLASLILRLIRGEAGRKLVAEGVVCLAAAALVFSPQMVVWRLLYGSFLTIPQGASFLSHAPAISGVLFSPWHGLFSWSPLLYVGALGLLPLAWRDPWKGVPILVFLALLVTVNARTADWWGGAAFGARRFDSALPFLGLGLAFAFGALIGFSGRHPRALPAGVGLAFILWNVSLALGYRSGLWDVSEPVTFEEMGAGAAGMVDRSVGSPFSLPGALLAKLLHGTPIRDYEASFAERRHARFLVRMGVDDSLYLEGGWSAPRLLSGETSRLMRADAGLVEVLMVPEAALRPGRNFVSFRPLEGETACAGAWLEPGSGDDR
jgi:hypothetical protein